MAKPRDAPTTSNHADRDRLRQILQLLFPRQTPYQQIVDHALNRAAQRNESVLGPRQLLGHLQRIDDFRPQRKQSLKLVGKFSDVLVGCTFQGIAEPALENQMSGAHDCELYTRC